MLDVPVAVRAEPLKIYKNGLRLQGNSLLSIKVHHILDWISHLLYNIIH